MCQSKHDRDHRIGKRKVGWKFPKPKEGKRYPGTGCTESQTRWTQTDTHQE